MKSWQLLNKQTGGPSPFPRKELTMKLRKMDLQLMAIELMMQQIDSCNYILGDDEDREYEAMTAHERDVLYDEFKKEYRKLLMKKVTLVSNGAVGK